MTALELTLVYLLAAVLGVVACRSLKLPPMLGYLAVGVVIGPNALALAQNSEGVRHLGEFGVVFLMFVIGLEFNLAKLRAMRSLVFGLGLLQVALTMIAATLATLFIASLAPKVWAMSWQTALALSGALAMSSTAIVVKLMVERLEMDSEHGKRVMGVLLFQDLAVVPLLVLIPALGAAGEQLAGALALAGLKATALIAVLLVGGQHAMRWWLTLVARRKSEELFVLNLLFITLGLAWLTELAGLSLALGAFIAGMLISETEYKHQVETDIRPFHDVLLGLFFISIGMLLDWRLVLERLPLVLLLVTLPVLFKAVLVAFLSKGLGASWGVSLRTGLYLAQAGEFGFVLLTPGPEERAGTANAAEPDSCQHGAIDAGDAVHHHVQQPHRDEAGIERMAPAVGPDDDDCPQVDQRQQARDHLRIRPQRAEPGAHARGRRHSVHGARPGSRPGPASGGGRRLGCFWRRGQAAGIDGGRAVAR